MSNAERALDVEGAAGVRGPLSWRNPPGRCMARIAPPSRDSSSINGPAARGFVIRRRGCSSFSPGPASPIDFDGGGSGISCEAIVHAVAKHRFRRLLVEAGAYSVSGTVSRFLKEGQLDRLHIQLALVVLARKGRSSTQAASETCGGQSRACAANALLGDD